MSSKKSVTKLKSITKVETVIDLAQRKSGVTLEQIAQQLKISPVAASSLIADARRNKGVKIKYADGVYRVV
jgi:DNA-binding transcriptional regulator LsrR (DeoR family)